MTLSGACNVSGRSFTPFAMTRIAPRSLVLEEGEEMIDAASLALRMWNEHRLTAALPPWRVVGLEVIDRDTYQARPYRHPSRKSKRLRGASKRGEDPAKLSELGVDSGRGQRVPDDHGGGAEHGGVARRFVRSQSEGARWPMAASVGRRILGLPASRLSPACASAPPITMTDGLNMLTQAASTSPMSRPA